jgi:hypothetical protein
LLSGRILLRFVGFRQSESSGSPLIAKNARKRAILTVVMKVIKQRFARRANRLEIKVRPVESFTVDGGTQRPLIRKVRE